MLFIKELNTLATYMTTLSCCWSILSHSIDWGSLQYDHRIKRNGLQHMHEVFHLLRLIKYEILSLLQLHLFILHY